MPASRAGEYTPSGLTTEKEEAAGEGTRGVGASWGQMVARVRREHLSSAGYNQIRVVVATVVASFNVTVTVV